MTIEIRHLGQAARSLRRRPGFLAVAVVSLALAIALNTTMYSVLDAMLDPRVDVRAPDRIFTLRYYGDYRHRLDASAIATTLATGVHGYEAVTPLSAYPGPHLPVTHAGHLRQLSPFTVGADFFRFLGVQPQEGHLEPAPSYGGTGQVVISDRLATALFPDAGSPVGQSLEVDGTPYLVIGVVAHSPLFPMLDADVWVFAANATSLSAHAWLIRLRADADSLSATRDLAVLAARLAMEAGESPRDTRFGLKRVATRQMRIGTFHLALIAAVLAVLLVACANLANLQLARGISRSRELAVRSALGATRSALVRELVADVVVISAAGLALGLLLTAWGMHLVRASVPPSVENWIFQPHTSWRLVVCAMTAALVCVGLVGVVPAWRVSRVDPSEVLKAGAGTGAHKQNLRRYGMLLVAQIGLALPLLSGAVLLLRSAWRNANSSFVSHEWYGYDPFPLVVANIEWRSAGATALSGAAAVDLAARTRAIEGVADAAADAPVAPDSARITMDDGTGPVEVPAPAWKYHAVSSSFLHTMGIATAAGRDFVAGETDAPPVIVDGGTALYLWHGADPIGRLIKLGCATSRAPWLQVVGVAGDLRSRETIERFDPYFGRHLGVVYRLMTPGDTLAMRNRTRPFTLVVRARRSPAHVALVVRQHLREMPMLDRASVLALVDQYGFTRRREQTGFIAALFTIFAVLALALAALGVYGIVSHTVAERRRELAVRISLGASARQIVRSAIRDGNVLALAGLAIGLFLTWQTANWVSPFLVDYDDLFNAPLFLGIAVLLFGIAAAAALIPALRATRIDPAEALRHE